MPIAASGCEQTQNIKCKMQNFGIPASRDKFFNSDTYTFHFDLPCGVSRSSVHTQSTTDFALS
jgi:hypothetical protein